MLQLVLTDGVTPIVAIEYEPISSLRHASLSVFIHSLDTAPGTKVLLKDPEFYNGRLLLRQTHIKVLGGVVQELYDAWKAQEVAMQRRFEE